MRTFLLVILSLVIVHSTFSQRGGGKRGPGKGPAKGSISGKVVDGDSRKAMDYVSVSIYRMESSDLIKGDITEQNGEFNITELPLGKMRVELNFVGYKTLVINDVMLTRKEFEVDLGKIVFKGDGETLNTIEVIGETAKVKYELDKKVINVESLSSMASETAIEILETVPSITVDIDGNVSLRGNSNFSLLIDGQPSAMDVSDALRTIPAATIKDIEIITNPSAKYDAEGTGGFINIILKRNRLEGVSALINANVGNFNTYSGDANVSWTAKKFSANLNGNYRNMNRPAELTSTRTVTRGADIFESESNGDFNREMVTGHLTGEFTYKPNRKNHITVSGTLRKFEMNTGLDLGFKRWENMIQTESSITDEASLRDFHNNKLFVEYKHFFGGKKKHYLKARSFISRFDGVENATTNFLNAETLAQYGGFRNLETGPSDLARYNLDYSYTLPNEALVEVGAQAEIGSSRDNNMAFKFDSATNVFIDNPQFSQNVQYTRDVYAGYAIFGHKLGKLKYQLGLRAEQTDRGVQYEQETPIDQIDRLDFFPSAHFSYQWSKSFQTMANYSRRINRPRSWYFEPFYTFRDELSLRVGNPDLLPEYINSYEIGMIKEIKKGSISAEFYHRVTENSITRVRSIYDGPLVEQDSFPVTLTTFANIGEEIASGLELDFNYKISKVWRSQLAANIFNYNLKGSLNDVNYDTESQSFTLRFNNNFNFKKGYKVQVSSSYNSKIVTAQGTRLPSWEMGASLKKFFFDKKLGVTLSARNIFGTARRQSETRDVNLVSIDLRQPSYPSVAVSFSFKINNYKFKKVRNTGGDEF